MADIHIHIGVSRTGTTVLQKHILPKANKTLIISKKPLQPAIPTGDHTSFLQKIDEGLNNGSMAILMNTQEGQYKLFQAISILSTCLAVNPETLSLHPGFPILVKLIKFLSSTLKNENILISSERLSETAASLNGQSYHSKHADKVFNIYPLIEASIAAGVYLKIIVCLRHPIEYLKSKYLRVSKQREGLRARPLSPQEYIKKQMNLEAISPGSSALSAAMHSEFVSNLQKNSFVKAFGFEDLIRSKDVFALLGINEDQKLSFDMFPQENHIANSGSSIHYVNLHNAIELTIKEDKDAYGKIAKAMLYL